MFYRELLRTADATINPHAPAGGNYWRKELERVVDKADAQAEQDYHGAMADLLGSLLMIAPLVIAELQATDPSHGLRPVR